MGAAGSPGAVVRMMRRRCWRRWAKRNSRKFDAGRTGSATASVAAAKASTARMATATSTTIIEHQYVCRKTLRITLQSVRLEREVQGTQLQVRIPCASHKVLSAYQAAYQAAVIDVTFAEQPEI